VKMKRYFNPGWYRFTLVLIFLVAGFSFKSHAQSIQAEARLDRTSMPIGDQTILHIIAHVPAKSSVIFPDLHDSLGTKVPIVNSLRPDTVIDKNNPGQETITHNYTITSFDTGVYVIPQYKIRTKTDSAQTGTITFQITSVKVDTTKTFYDIKRPFDVRYNLLEWLKDNWPFIVIPLVVILLIVALMSYQKRRPIKQLVAVKKAEPILPDDTIALNKLYKLRDKKLWQQEQVKQYHSELSDVMREYLEKRYNIHTFEKTTDEIFAALKYMDIPQESRNKLSRILVLADLVKFAKEKPLPEDNELSLEYAVNFIMQTRQVPQPPENNKEGAK
jgi:hypothetical protein